MITTVHAEPDSSSGQSLENRDKPAMAVRTPAIQPGPGRVLPGAPPRGPRVDLRKLDFRFDLRISPALRDKLKAAAKQRGVPDAVYVRDLIQAAVGGNDVDARTLPRKREPSELLMALSSAVREIGAAHEPLAKSPPDVAGVKMHLGTARDGLAALIRQTIREAGE